MYKFERTISSIMILCRLDTPTKYQFNRIYVLANYVIVNVEVFAMEVILDIYTEQLNRF